MEDLNDKITGSTLTADEWNQVPSELQNVIEDQGITLSGADLNQLGKAIAGYVANGDFYVDTGVANAYVLGVVGSRQAPPSLTDGFSAVFIPSNVNTGASTVNVAGFGLKNIRRPDGTALVSGDLTNLSSIRFDSGADYFRLLNFVPDATTTSKGIVELATTAETEAGTDATKAVTPEGLTELFTNNSDLASNGHQELPGGLIYQWGLTSNISGNTTLTVTLPITFPTACRSVVASRNTTNIGGGYEASINTNVLSTSQIRISNADLNTATCYWVAIGY